MEKTRIQVLDHGYVRFVESWGHGDAEVAEAGIIEAARQSTQKSFQGWGPIHLEECPVNSDDAWMAGGSAPQCTCIPKPGDEKLLRFLQMNDHTGPFEFAGAVIEVQAPIFVFREWHRHRTQSYNEMSARYAPLPDLNYIPTVERLMVGGGHLNKNKQAGAAEGARELTLSEAEWFQAELRGLNESIQDLYRQALERGVPKELARIPLPVGRYSRMRASANLLNWLRFLTLRSSQNAQWEIRQYAEAVMKILEEQFPRTMALFAERKTK